MKTRIEKKDNRTKRLFIPVTLEEHQKIKEVSKREKVKIAELVRFAVKQVIEM